MTSIIVALFIGFACGFLVGWGGDKRQSEQVPHKPSTLYHVDGHHGLSYMVETLDEARDMADWLDESGQLRGFWYEEIEA